MTFGRKNTKCIHKNSADYFHQLHSQIWLYLNVSGIPFSLLLWLLIVRFSFHYHFRWKNCFCLLPFTVMLCVSNCVIEKRIQKKMPGRWITDELKHVPHAPCRSIAPNRHTHIFDTFHSSSSRSRLIRIEFTKLTQIIELLLFRYFPWNANQRAQKWGLVQTFLQSNSSDVEKKGIRLSSIDARICHIDIAVRCWYKR